MALCIKTALPVERERLFDCEAFWLWRSLGNTAADSHATMASFASRTDELFSALSMATGREITRFRTVGGAPERNLKPLLNGGLSNLYAWLAEEADRRGIEIHWTTAWQMYQAADALVHGVAPVALSVGTDRKKSAPSRRPLFRAGLAALGQGETDSLDRSSI